MDHPVMILTDSSAYLPSDLVARYPIQVLPLMLTWDGQSYRDGVDIQTDEFYRRLSTSDTLPHTSQLSAEEIKSSVHSNLEKGYDVLVMPISSGISNTYTTALGAVQNFPKKRVAVLNTNLVCMALGFQVLAAARAAKSGADLPTCVRIAGQAYGNIGEFGIIDNLKYLAAGGRINTAARLLSSAINLKPILQFRDGKVELAGSAITRRKAVARMLELAEKEMGNRTPMRICVFHALAEDPARELLAMAQERFSPVESILAEFSPVVGAHVGPGTLAMAFHAGTEEALPPYPSSGQKTQHLGNQFQKTDILEPAYARQL